VLAERLLDRDEILERLGHLEALDVQVAGMEEVVDPLVVAVVGLGLRELVVVVRELEVRSAGVDIHVGTEDVARDDRALNVPAGAARTPRRGPRGLSRLGALPERKVVRILLLRRLRWEEVLGGGRR
jgi:hypothetical protein